VKLPGAAQSRVLRTTLALAGGAYGGWLMVEGPWTIAGTVIGACILVATLFLIVTTLIEWVRPGRRLKALIADPADVQFLIPSRARGCDHAIQDERNHLVTQLILPPNSDTLVEIRIAPRHTFETHTLQFGTPYTEGDEEGYERKPRALSYLNPFIAVGVDRAGVPGETPGHKINTHGYYQLEMPWYWNPQTIRVIGLKVRTRSKGTYEWQTVLAGADFVAFKKLSIVVTNLPLRMNCINPAHEAHDILPILNRRPLLSC